MKHFILFLVISLACVGMQAQSKNKYNEFIIERSACFGKCPVFQIRLFQNGDVYFKGKKNVSKIGVYKGKLSLSKTRKFFKALDSLSWSRYEDRYKNPATDLPHLKIQIYGEAFYKSIIQAEAGPKELELVALRLEGMIKGVKWTKLKYETPPTSVPESEPDLPLEPEGNSVGIEGIVETESSNTPSAPQPEVFSYVEQMPEFPGGYDALMTFLRNNIQYPEVAREMNISGKVICQFIVYKDGSVGEIKILRGIHPSCDSEAIRVLKKMPLWKSGKQNGAPVNVRMNLPINFVLK